MELQRAATSPITIDVLRMLISFLVLVVGQCDDRMFSAAKTLACLGFLCGEFTTPNQNAFQPHRHLSIQHVIFYPTMDEAAYITIRYKYSKTDRFGKGHRVTLHATNTLIVLFKQKALSKTQAISCSENPYFCWLMVWFLLASTHIDVY